MVHDEHLAKAVVDELREQGYEVVNTSGAPLHPGGPYHIYTEGGEGGAGTYLGRLVQVESGEWRIETVDHVGHEPEPTKVPEGRAPTTIVFVAYCPVNHPPDQRGVTPEGTWYGDVRDTSDAALADATNHEHGEARVVSYAQA